MTEEEKFEEKNDFAAFIARRPWTTMTLMFWFMMAGWIVGLPLKPMQKRIQLAGFDKELLGDFSDRAQQATTNYYVLWCKHCDIKKHPEYLEDQGRVLRVLQKVKEREFSCRDIVWSTHESPGMNMKAEEFLSLSGSAALVAIDLGNKPDKCSHFMSSYLRGIRGQRSGDVKGGLSGTISVMEGAVVAMTEETMKHQIILIPIMAVLLFNVMGGCCRTLATIFMMMWAQSGSTGFLLILKRIFPDLDVGFMSNQIGFFCLAFCVDYGIFFWSRLQKLREDHPAKEDYLNCIAEAIRKTTEVVMTSSMVVCACFFANMVWPGYNTYGYVGMYFQLGVAIGLCGLFSMTVQTSWAAAVPSLFDNREPGVRGCISACLPSVMSNVPEGRKFWRTWAGFTTRGKSMFLVPLVIYGAMVPFVVCWFNFEGNYNLTGMMNYDGIPETEAFKKMNEHFGASKAAKWQYVIKAHELGPTQNGAALLQVDERGALISGSLQLQTAEEVAFAQHAMKMSRKGSSLHTKLGHGIVMEPEFGAEVCKFGEQLIEWMRKNTYKMDESMIESIWYGKDPFGKGKHGCRTLDDLATGLQEEGTTWVEKFNDDVTADGKQLMLVFYPGLEATEKKSKDLYHVLRDGFEHEIPHEMELNGKRYWFSAKHTSTITALSEEYVNCLRAAPIVIIITLASSFLGVAFMFKSAFLPLKFFMTVIVPIVTVLGLAVSVFQEGWFDWLGLSSVSDDGGMSFNLWLAVCPMLFGLAMDYDIFLFARVYEYRMEGYDNISAVQKGLVATGPIITSAGVFMLMSFFFMMLCGIRVLMQLGFCYFFGVLFDTFVIRTCIAPSVLCWGETLNFWPGYIPPVTKSYNVDDENDEDK